MTKIQLEILYHELRAILAHPNARIAAQHRLYQITPLLFKKIKRTRR